MRRKISINLVLTLFICTAAVFFNGCGRSAASNKLYPVFKDGKWGYINNQGKIVIEPQFDAARDFHDGLALVSKYDKSGNKNPVTNQSDDKDGYIDETGKFVIEPQFVSQRNSGEHSHDDFSEGLAIVQVDWSLDNSTSLAMWKRNYACIDKTGKVVFKLDPKYHVVSNFSDGRLLFKDESTKNHGYLDKTGKVVIEPVFITAFPFSEGLAAVSNFNKKSTDSSKNIYYGFIDPDGKTIIDLQFKWAGSFSEGLALVTEDGEYFGYIDKTDKMVIKPQFKAAGDFHEGLAVLPQIASYQFTDKDGKVIPGDNGTILTNFSEGAALIADDKKKLQIIDKSGKIVAPAELTVTLEQVDSVSDFKGGLLRIKTKDYSWYYLNMDGKVVWQGKLG
jgi:WG containing repeat